jgi:LVIVD repeat
MTFRLFRPFARRPLWAAGLTSVCTAALVAAGCGGGSGDATDGAVVTPATIIEANIDTLAAQIGGGTQDVELYNDGTADWTLYTMANRFAATPIGMSKGAVSEITVPGYIQHITVVKAYGGQNYALLSMGSKGIGVVNITNPAAMTYVRTMSVNYLPPEYTYSDGGGTVFTEAAAVEPLTNGPVADLLVDDGGTPDNTDDALFVANAAFGIQKTRLSNLLEAGSDGVLTIDGVQVWTMKYAGENPWGGPLSLKQHGGRLYAALGFLGLGIYDPATLARQGAYNLYTDCANSAQEDWFGFPNRKPACNTALLANPAFVDADGMPTHEQAAAELGDKNSLGAYPWAEFDRYGNYYNARSLDLVDLPGGKTLAYVAYSLSGLVAVDVTSAANPVYEAYVPAAPAHGPDEPPVNVDKKGILSHFGSGMLKEAGVMNVRVVADPDDGTKFQAYYTDHFAGLVVVSGAESPGAQWRNGSHNNDTDPRVFWPDYEFVRSYDMTPVPVGDESMPKFLTAVNGNYTAPVMLVTGEINGHGGSLFMVAGNTRASGQVDVVESSGAGGVSFVDIIDLKGAGVAVASRFAVPVNLVSTNELGAAEDGSATQPIAIGHAEGVTVSGNHLYLGDGPHGVSVWRIADGLTPIDDLHLVANTLQSEYPTGDTVLPTPHAFKVGFGDDPTKAYVMSQSLGMRRLDVSSVISGTAQVGAPALLNAKGGIFEHNTEAGSVGTVSVTGQDHAYGMTFRGKYAIVADGDNGLTVYDTTADPATGAHVVANIGDSEGTSGKPPLGRAATVKLWKNEATQRTYAVVAAGSYGVSVVDMTDFLATGRAQDLTVGRHLIKTFEPLKADDDNAFGSADGKSVDVHVVGDMAYFSYDSFGLVAYRMADLIRPATLERPAVVPMGQAPDACLAVTDVTKLSAKQGGVAECRPTAAGYFKLQKLAGYENVDGGALYMTPQFFPANQLLSNGAGSVYTLSTPRLLFYVGYGDAGVVKLDWSNVAAPSLMGIKGVVGGGAATAIHNGRVYVAAGAGGLSVFK